MLEWELLEMVGECVYVCVCVTYGKNSKFQDT